MARVSTPTPADRAGLDQGRAAAYVAGLVDDAAVFPPGDAPVPEALAAHRAHRQVAHGLVVGPLLVPVSRMAELLDALDASPDSAPVDLVLVADTGMVEFAEARIVLLDDDRVDLLGLEVALPRDELLGPAAEITLATLDFALPAAVEVPRAPGWRDALRVLGTDGAERAKFRTGGPTPQSYPTESELAELVVAAVQEGVAFKLTAGLHHALRRTAPGTGFEEHGFLNVLAATAAALEGHDVAHVAALLAEREAAPLLAVLADADPAAVRRRFTSFGSCSVDEPVADMRQLGLLAALDDDAEVEA